MKRRPVSKNRKVGTVDRDPRTARRYAPNERRRHRDTRLQRETVSSRVRARLSTAARAGNAACASRRRVEGGWSREVNAQTYKTSCFFRERCKKARGRGVGVSNEPRARTSSGSRCDVSDACDHVRATPNRRVSHARVRSAASRARDPPAHRLRTATRLRSVGPCHLDRRGFAH